MRHLPAHHAAEGQGVLDLPRLRGLAQQREFDRFRRVAALRTEAGIDARGVCLDHRAVRFAHEGPVCTAQPVEPERATGAIRIQRQAAEQFAQTPTRKPAIDLHLPEPVLRVHEPLGKEGIKLF